MNNFGNFNKEHLRLPAFKSKSKWYMRLWYFVSNSFSYLFKGEIRF